MRLTLLNTGAGGAKSQKKKPKNQTYRSQSM